MCGVRACRRHDRDRRGDGVYSLRRPNVQDRGQGRAVVLNAPFPHAPHSPTQPNSLQVPLFACAWRCSLLRNSRFFPAGSVDVAVSSPSQRRLRTPRRVAGKKLDFVGRTCRWEGEIATNYPPKIFYPPQRPTSTPMHPPTCARTQSSPPPLAFYLRVVSGVTICNNICLCVHRPGNHPDLNRHQFEAAVAAYDELTDAVRSNTKRAC